MFFRFSEVIFVLLDGLKKERLLVVSEKRFATFK